MGGGEIFSRTEGGGIEDGRRFSSRRRIRESIFLRILLLLVHFKREIRSARSRRSGKGSRFGNSLLIDFMRIASNLRVDRGGIQDFWRRESRELDFDELSLRLEGFSRRFEEEEGLKDVDAILENFMLDLAFTASELILYR